MSALERAVHIFRVVLSWCAEISSVLIFVLVLLITADIIGRYVFLSPVPGTLEITESLMVFIVFLAYAHTEAGKHNIRIQIIERRITQRQKYLLDALAYTLGILVFGVICWQGWEQAWPAGNRAHCLCES